MLTSILLNTIKSVKGVKKGLIFTNSGLPVVGHNIENLEYIAANLANLLRSKPKKVNLEKYSMIKLLFMEEIIFIVKGEEVSIAVFTDNANIKENYIYKKLSQTLAKVEKILR